MDSTTLSTNGTKNAYTGNSIKWHDWATKAMEFPESVQFEVTNHCNAKCVMCPVNNGSKRKKEHLDIELFKKGVNECVPYRHRLTQLLLHQNGEPMMIGADRLAWMVKYVKDRMPNVPVGIFTNGSLMGRVATEKILDSGIDTIVFSFDGGDKETYEKVRKGLNFEEVYLNIVYFAQRKREKKLEKPHISVLLLPQIDNWRSHNNYQKLFANKGIDSVGGGGINNYAGYIDTDKIKIAGQYDNGNRYSPCWRLWTFLIIGSNGTPLLCCNDVDIPIDLGSLKTMTMKEIWDGTGFRKAREYHLNHWQDKMPLCKDCDWMKTFLEPEWWYKDGYDRVN